MRLASCILLCFCVSISIAQRSNVAHINTNELWKLMPEKEIADSAVKELQKELSSYYQELLREYKKGALELQADSTMNELIKKEKMDALNALNNKLTKLEKSATGELNNKREELYKPIREKMEAAIATVAKKYKYDYVLDVSYGNIIYVKNEADNILDLVKKELGLPDSQ